MAMNPIIQDRRKERRLYIWFAVLMPLIVLAGFARTYYLKGFFGNPPLPGMLVQVHGLVMTSWVVLFIAQVSLVARRRVRAHQRLGILGAVLAALIVIVGTMTAIAAAARGASPGPPALQFLVIPLGDMLVFAILVGMALYWRRKRLDAHKRLMLLAAINLLAPAIARIPLGFIANGGALAFFGLTDLCLLVCVGVDTIRNRRLHPAFLWGTIFIIAAQPLRLMLAGTGLWLRFATALVAMWK
jgi:hypothetical protein